MHCREDEVSGHGRLKCGLRGLGIANLPNQNDIRILTKYRTQSLGESESGFLVDLNLSDPIDLVLDGVFNRYNIQRLLTNFIDQGIERCGFAAARWDDNQNHALWSSDQCVQKLLGV